MAEELLLLSSAAGMGAGAGGYACHHDAAMECDTRMRMKLMEVRWQDNRRESMYGWIHALGVPRHSCAESSHRTNMPVTEVSDLWKLEFC